MGGGVEWEGELMESSGEGAVRAVRAVRAVNWLCGCADAGARTDWEEIGIF